MGLNPSRLQPDRTKTQYRKAYTKGGVGNSDFPFVQPRDLPDGEYHIRFLPEFPGRCSDGYRRVWTHTLFDKIETTKKDAPYFYCLTLEGQDCCACDLLNALQEHIGGLNETAQTALSELSIFEQFLIPCVIDATHVRPPTEADKWPPFKKTEDGKRFGAIFQLKNLKRLDDEIAALLAADPFVNDLHQGRELIFSRSSHIYNLRINPAQADRCPLPESERIWMDQMKYPNIDAMFKKALKLQYAEQWDRIRSAFWWQYVAHLKIDLADETVADDIAPWTASSVIGDLVLPY